MLRAHIVLIRYQSSSLLKLNAFLIRQSRILNNVAKEGLNSLTPPSTSLADTRHLWTDGETVTSKQGVLKPVRAAIDMIKILLLQRYERDARNFPVRAYCGEGVSSLQIRTFSLTAVRHCY